MNVNERCVKCEPAWLISFVRVAIARAQQIAVTDDLNE